LVYKDTRSITHLANDVITNIPLDFIIITSNYTNRVKECVNNRKFRLPVRFRFLIATLIMPLSLLAQLTAPGRNAVRYTSYPSAPSVKDSIFFYCNRTGFERGTLMAHHPGGAGTYNFAWFKWNDLTNSFNIPIKNESGVSSSSVNNLTEGGYKVEIDSAGFIKSFTAWIFFDLPPIAEAKLGNPMKSCYYVALDGTAQASVPIFIYRDPGTGLQKGLSNEITFLWSSTPSSAIPLPDFYIDPITYSPPVEDVTYNLKVNSLGCSSESSFFYESIRVKADFTVDPVEGEAPLTVAFENKSVRGSLYKWEFGDDSQDSELETPEDHTYFVPGSYSIKLTVESNLHCIDAVSYDSIVVEPSYLHIPNVFTPNDDGYNDRFKVEAKSLKFISVEVFSQSGLKVYGFSGEGDRLKDWTGWDGKINNTSINASPGVYFYIIRALGWDNVRYDSKLYRGFLYLYR
jgi:gliding motility-associated-like protein